MIKAYQMPLLLLSISTILLFSSVFVPDSVFASGWYVRGAAGYERSLDTDFSDMDCASTHPPALFGCVAGGDGRSIGACGDFGRFPLLEIAAGRRFLPWLRADLAFSYRFNMDYEGNANFLSVGLIQPVSAKADSLTGMANVFIDLNGFFRPGALWRFQPYAGGGIGLAYNRLGEMTFLFPENPGAHKISITPSGDRKDFAFMLAVGTGFALTEKLILDVAWRYFDLGRMETSPGNMFMDTRPEGIAISGIESRMRSHGVTLGLRYHF